MTRAAVLAWLLELILDGPPPPPASMHEATTPIDGASIIELAFDGAETFRIYVVGPIEPLPSTAEARHERLLEGSQT
jgi:hypothetical protein